MGLSAIAILVYTGGLVDLLVVMYSINVFFTFTLSQLGMCVHWWQVRKQEPTWGRRFAINGFGLLLTSHDPRRHRRHEVPAGRLGDRG